MRLILSYLVLFLMLGWTAPASAEDQPDCSVQGEILAIRGGNEKFIDFHREAAPGEKSLVFRVLSAKSGQGVSGDCGFVKEEHIVRTSGGSSPDALIEGVVIEAQATYRDGNPGYIHWQPVKARDRNNQPVSLPADYYLRSEIERGLLDDPRSP